MSKALWRIRFISMLCFIVISLSMIFATHPKNDDRFDRFNTALNHSMDLHIALAVSIAVAAPMVIDLAMDFFFYKRDKHLTERLIFALSLVSLSSVPLAVKGEYSAQAYICVNQVQNVFLVYAPVAVLHKLRPDIFAGSVCTFVMIVYCATETVGAYLLNDWRPDAVNIMFWVDFVQYIPYAILIVLIYRTTREIYTRVVIMREAVSSDDLVALIFMYSSSSFCVAMVTFNNYYGVTLTTKSSYHLCFTVYAQIVLTVFMVVLPSRIVRFEVSQVEQSLDVKRKVARHIYHEMRTPLNIVVIGLELLSKAVLIRDESQATTPLRTGGRHGSACSSSTGVAGGGGNRGSTINGINSASHNSNSNNNSNQNSSNQDSDNRQCGSSSSSSHNTDKSIRDHGNPRNGYIVEHQQQKQTVPRLQQGQPMSSLVYTLDDSQAAQEDQARAVAAMAAAKEEERVENIAELVSSINISCNSAIEILNEMLAYEKIEGGMYSLECAYFNVRPFVHTAVQPFMVQAQSKNIRMLVDPLVMDLSDHDITTPHIDDLDIIISNDLYVRIDPVKMHQVMRNLLSNALKFTPVGGRVEVAMAVHRCCRDRNAPSMMAGAETSTKRVTMLPPKTQMGKMTEARSSGKDDTDESLECDNGNIKGTRDKAVCMLRNLARMLVPVRSPVLPMLSDFREREEFGYGRGTGTGTGTGTASGGGSEIEGGLHENEHERDRDQFVEMTGTTMSITSRRSTASSSVPKYIPYTGPKPPTRKSSRAISNAIGNWMGGPESGRVLRISVTDDGAGISPENMRLLFREGVQFDANHMQGGGGSGFGLSILRGIVELHGGQVGVQCSGLGCGATFVVDLPVYILNPAYVEKAGGSSAAGTIGGYRGPLQQPVLHERNDSPILCRPQPVPGPRSNSITVSRPSSSGNGYLDSGSGSMVSMPTVMGNTVSANTIGSTYGNNSNLTLNSHPSSKTERERGASAGHSHSHSHSHGSNTNNNNSAHHKKAANLKHRPSNRLHVLLVDDSALTRKLMRKLISTLSGEFLYEVDDLGSGEEAVDRVRVYQRHQQEQLRMLLESPQHSITVSGQHMQSQQSHSHTATIITTAPSLSAGGVPSSPGAGAGAGSFLVTTRDSGAGSSIGGAAGGTGTGGVRRSSLGLSDLGQLSLNSERDHPIDAELNAASYYDIMFVDCQMGLLSGPEMIEQVLALLSVTNNSHLNSNLNSNQNSNQNSINNFNRHSAGAAADLCAVPVALTPTPDPQDQIDPSQQLQSQPQPSAVYHNGTRRPFIVGLTGLGEPEDLQRFEQAGAQLTLIKPLDGKALVSVFQQYAVWRQEQSVL